MLGIPVQGEEIQNVFFANALITKGLRALTLSISFWSETLSFLVREIIKSHRIHWEKGEQSWGNSPPWHHGVPYWPYFLYVLFLCLLSLKTITCNSKIYNFGCFCHLNSESQAPGEAWFWTPSVTQHSGVLLISRADSASVSQRPRNIHSGRKWKAGNCVSPYCAVPRGNSTFWIDIYSSTHIRPWGDGAECKEIAHSEDQGLLFQLQLFRKTGFSAVSSVSQGFSTWARSDILKLAVGIQHATRQLRERTKGHTQDACLRFHEQPLWDAALQGRLNVRVWVLNLPGKIENTTVWRKALWCLFQLRLSTKSI